MRGSFFFRKSVEKFKFSKIGQEQPVLYMMTDAQF